jgi:hypothetical protein
MKWEAIVKHQRSYKFSEQNCSALESFLCCKIWSSIQQWNISDLNHVSKSKIVYLRTFVYSFRWVGNNGDKSVKGSSWRLTRPWIGYFDYHYYFFFSFAVPCNVPFIRTSRAMGWKRYMCDLIRNGSLAVCAWSIRTGGVIRWQWGGFPRLITSNKTPGRRTLHTFTPDGTGLLFDCIRILQGITTEI